MTRRMPHYHQYKSCTTWHGFSISDRETREKGRDTCLRSWRECECGKGHWVKKRRPRDVQPEDCIWLHTWCADHPDKHIETEKEYFSRLRGDPLSNTIKYAIFNQVRGEWHDEGFYIPTDDTPPEKQIAEMRVKCESENGRGTFRSYAFLDEPSKDPVADALLNESMG